MKMKVAIVGCGGIARVHAGILTGMKDIDLCAFADCKPDRAGEFNETFCGGRAHVYESFEKMLLTEKPDVVHICTPHYLHVPMSVEALNQGISVFMEKPPAISCEQFQYLKQTLKQSKGRLGICFQNRYNASTRKVDELLQDGSLGEIKGARAFVTWNREPEYYRQSDWRGTWETEGGGVLINQAVHTLDLLLRWLGEPEFVEGTLHNHHLQGVVEVEDTVEAFLRFPGGKRACFYATTAYAADTPILIEIECEKGRIRLEEEKVCVKYFDGEEVIFLLRAGSIPGKSYWGSGHAACISDFYRCLREGASYDNDLASAANTFQVMMNIYQNKR